MFITTREVLEKALRQVSLATERRSTLPILSHVLVWERGNSVSLYGTNLTITIEAMLPVERAGTERYVVPCKLFLETVRRMAKKSTVRVEMVDGKVQVMSGPDGCQSGFTLPTMDVEDYPAITNMQCFRPVDVAGFLFALDRVTFAASNDESRFNLNGVLIENEYHWSKLTATDGHRLAQARCPALWKDKSKMIVPKLGVLTAMSLFRKAKELKTSVDDKNLCLQSEDVRLMIRLIDGDYPDYRKVIPAPEPAAFVVERQAWLNALTALEPFTGERNKGVQFMIDGDMSITAENPDLGHQTVKVPLKSNGHKRAPLINLCYMEDILRATTADVIHVQCAEDNGMPLVFRPDGRNDYFSLVMPMRK